MTQDAPPTKEGLNAGGPLAMKKAPSQKEFSPCDWRPSGIASDMLTVPVTAELVEVMTVTASSAKAIMWTWARYKEQVQALKLGPGEGYDPEIISALLDLRRIKTACGVLPLLEDIANLKVLEEPVRTKLLVLACELNADSIARSLFRRFRGTRMRPVWYHALVRLAAELASSCDFAFAAEVVDEMTQHNVPTSGALVRQMLHGCSRLTPIPLGTALSLMDHRLRSPNCEGCVLHQFLSILETLPGSQTGPAVDYIRQMAPALLHGPIQTIAANAPAVECPGCHDDSSDKKVNYYVIDPFSGGCATWCVRANPEACSVNPHCTTTFVDQPFDATQAKEAAHDISGPEQRRQRENTIEAYTKAKAQLAASIAAHGNVADRPHPTIPPNTYVCFLYSSIRMLAEKIYLSDAFPCMVARARTFKYMLDYAPSQCLIMPLEAELLVRLPENGPCYSHHDKMIAFLRGVERTRCLNVATTLVTKDPQLIALAKQLEWLTTVPEIPF